jgi:hypothetical protein
MQYLNSSFSVSGPDKICGCPACIYGTKHGDKHTFDEACSLRNASHLHPANLSPSEASGDIETSSNA